MQVAAVIPTMNEDPHRLAHLVRALDKFCDSVIVVNHSDEPLDSEIVREAGGFVRRVPEPGFDAAYRAAWRVVPSDWYVAHIDAGGSHDPNDLAQMLDMADEGRDREYHPDGGYHQYFLWDIVIGSRFVRGGEHHGPWRRKVTSRLASSALNLISLGDISDWTSGLRVYSPKARRVLMLHDFTTTGHAWQIESLWTARDHGCRIVEHPITYLPSKSSLTLGRVREANRLYWDLAFR